MTRATSPEAPIPPLSEDWFGYIPFPFTATCGQYVLRPVDDLQKLVADVESGTNRDGFYYPSESSFRFDPLTGKRTLIPKSTRPALLYPMPHTHVVATRTADPLPPDFRSTEGGLLIHFLALLYESRCQFWNWCFEGRIRTKPDRIAWFRDDDTTLSRVLSMAHATWTTWKSERARMLCVNALWLHSRIPSYRLDWERFLMAYVVSDALWALSIELGRLPSAPRVPHPERLDRLAQQLALVRHPDVTQRFAILRNDLFHEGRWDKQILGSPAGGDAFMAEIRLRSLNARMILALGGVPCQFLKTDWLSMGQFELGVC